MRLFGADPKIKSLFSGFRSIRSRLLLFFIAAIAVPILILGIHSMSLLDQSLKEHSLSVEKEDLNQLQENVKYHLNSCIDLSNNVCFDSKIWEYFYYQYSYPAISTEGYYNLIRPVFTRYLALKKEVSRITVFTKNDTLLFNNFEIASITPGSFEDSLYQETMNSRKILWNFQEDNGEDKTIIMTRMLNLNNVNVGMLAVYLNEDRLYNAIKGQLEGSNTYLAAPGGLILTSTDREATGKNISRFEWDVSTGNSGIAVREMKTGEGVIRLASLTFTLQDSPKQQWTIVKTVPMKSVLSVASRTKAYQLGAFLLLLLILSLISVVLSDSITKRIKELRSKMKRVEQGDFGVSVHLKGRDEISYMGSAFNKMVERLDHLVRRVYEMQLSQKELELKNREAQLNMLQSQINPHFLFNTLDAVLYGIKNNRQETEKIVELLAGNFRRSIQWKEDLVPVREEIKFIEEYLAIHKFRMQDKLEWFTDVSSGVLDYKMPKMLIQPLIENSIHHGISMKKEKGGLWITVHLEQGFLVIKVEDDGMGMEEWRLEEIQQMLQDKEIKMMEGHIGIKNVYDRIRLFYGNEGQIQIKSEYHIGTTSELRLPVESCRGGNGCIKPIL